MTMLAPDYLPWSDFWRLKKYQDQSIELAKLLEYIGTFAKDMLDNRQVIWQGMLVGKDNELTVAVPASLVASAMTPLDGELYDAAIGSALYHIAETMWPLDTSRWAAPGNHQHYLESVLNMFRTRFLAVTAGEKFPQSNVRDRYVALFFRHMGASIDAESIYDRLREQPNARDAINALATYIYGYLPPTDLPSSVNNFLLDAMSSFQQVHQLSGRRVISLADMLYQKYLAHLPSDYEEPKDQQEPDTAQEDGVTDTNGEGTESEQSEHSNSPDKDSKSESGGMDLSDDKPGGDDTNNGEAEGGDSEDENGDEDEDENGDDEWGENGDEEESENGDDEWGDSEDTDAEGEDSEDIDTDNADADGGKKSDNLLPTGLYSNEPALNADLVNRVTDNIELKVEDYTEDLCTMFEGPPLGISVVIQDSPSDADYISKVLAVTAPYEEPIRQVLNLHEQRLRQLEYNLKSGRIARRSLHRLSGGTDGRVFQSRRLPQLPTLDFVLLMDWSNSMLANMSAKIGNTDCYITKQVFTQYIMAAVHRACQGRPNITSWAFGYDTDRDSHGGTFRVRVQRVAVPWRPSIMLARYDDIGGTPSGHAMGAVGQEILEKGKSDFKLILHLTDGMPVVFKNGMYVTPLKLDDALHRYTSGWTSGIPEVRAYLQSRNISVFCLALVPELWSPVLKLDYGEHFQIMAEMGQLPGLIRQILEKTLSRIK